MLKIFLSFMAALPAASGVPCEILLGAHPIFGFDAYVDNDVICRSDLDDFGQKPKPC